MNNAILKTIVLCLLWVTLALLTQTVAATDAASLDIPAEALDRLAEHVASLVENEEIVGGELHVIKNRKTVLHRAYGWKDRDAEAKLAVDSIYCVRSMTKPFVGTAIQMLIDEGKLTLDTPVHEILSSFKGPETGKITVEHLLTHTGGFPFTTLTRSLSEYGDIADVAAEAAARGVDFEPGSRFEYSDAGSDTLGAIVARITGKPVEKFIQERILDPLQMNDTVTLLAERSDVLERIPSTYSGGTGSWERHWSPSDKPIFPLFLNSQSLYSTTTDYARFLTFWMDAGRIGEKRLLSDKAVARALEPYNTIDLPRGFPDRGTSYGHQWVVYPADSGQADSGRVFGHSGSDGTYAWAWPELDLVVLFFTQSRGTLAGLSLEPLIQTLLIDQDLDSPSLIARVPSARELEQAAGLYWDETNNAAYYVVTPMGERLMMERPGRVQLIYKATATPGRFVHELRADLSIEFLRGESGKINSMRMVFGDNVEVAPLHQPDETLPSVDEVLASVRKASGVDRLSEVGPVRASGTLTFESRGIEGTVETLFDADRHRSELRFGETEQLVGTDGEEVWSYTTATGLETLEGALREQVLLDRYAVRFGDWSAHYASVDVLKRIRAKEHSVLIVRVVPKDSPGATMFVDEESGRVFRSEGLAQLPGMGVVGVRNDYRDVRDVEGMQVPFTTVSTYASPLIGKVVTQLETVEAGVDVADGAFSAPAVPAE